MVAMMDMKELRALVHEHCIFFDKLVEVIPSKYLKEEEDGQQTTWHHGMSKAARAAAKKATRKRLKKARRDRFDPEKISSTSKHIQQQGNHGSEKLEEKVLGFGIEENGKRASTYEELQERLRKRIEILRMKRHADAAADAARNAHSWRDQKKKESQKKRKKENGHRGGNMPPLKQQKSSEVVQDIVKKEEKLEVANLEFGRVKMNSSAGDMSKRHKKHKETKEQLLEKAERLHKDMQDPLVGQNISLKHSWSAAVSRAAGEKVLDDPKLLKKSLTKERQHKKKSAKKWKERRENEKKLAEEKQQKRSENIQERKEQKKERKLAKREKKLLRPGFEGRKEGFINA